MHKYALKLSQKSQNNIQNYYNYLMSWLGPYLYYHNLLQICNCLPPYLCQIFGQKWTVGDFVDKFLWQHRLQQGDDELFTSNGLFRVGWDDRRGWLLGTMFFEVFQRLVTSGGYFLHHRLCQQLLSELMWFIALLQIFNTWHYGHQR